MFGAHHLHHLLPGFISIFFRLKHDLLLFNTPHRPPQIPAEHEAVIVLSPVILGLLYAGGSEVLLKCPQCLLYEHPLPPYLPMTLGR